MAWTDRNWGKGVAILLKGILQTLEMYLMNLETQNLVNCSGITKCNESKPSGPPRNEQFVIPRWNYRALSQSYLVVGSFMTMTSASSPKDEKYSLMLSGVVCHDNPPTNILPGSLGISSGTERPEDL